MAWLTPLVVMLLGAAAFVLLQRLTALDPREPEEAPSNIPLIGHLIGLSRRSYHYYADLSSKMKQPIFTVRLLGQRFYVVTSVELIQAVQKASRALSWRDFEAEMTSKMGDFTPAFLQQLAINTNGEEGHFGLISDVHDAIIRSVRPGPGLDNMQRVAIRYIAKYLDEFAVTGNTQKLDLYTWTRQLIAMASTRAAYGPANPYNDQEVLDAFWQYEKGFLSLLFSPLPALTARQAIKARDTVAAAMKRYLDSGGWQAGSMLMQERFHAQSRNGLPTHDIALSETFNGMAIIVNTIPAAFWMILMIYSTPGVLQEVRAEIDANTIASSTEETTQRRIDVAVLRSECQLINSIYQEVLRWRSMGSSVRRVMEDYMLNDRYLLKKGALVQMPSYVVHTDAALWGSDVNEFRPRRFMKGEKQMTENGKRPSDSCYRPFGGGKTLCPGRHFAGNEVLAFVSVFVARFDLSPVSGTWVLPTTEGTNPATATMQPDSDVPVLIRARKGFEHCEWIVQLKEEEKESVGLDDATQ